MENAFSNYDFHCSFSLSEDQITEALGRFFGSHATSQHCCDFLCRLVEPTEGFCCRHCGAPCSNRKFGSKTFSCIHCKKKTNVFTGTIFQGARRVVAWAALIWLLSKGVVVSSNKFGLLLKIAQSSALNMFRKVTTLIVREMGDSACVPSSEFVRVFAKRSRETPAQEHPIAEQLHLDREITQTQVDTTEQTSNDEPAHSTQNSSPLLQLTYDEREIYEIISEAPLQVESISNRIEMPLCTISATLTQLELKNVIVRLPGDMYVKKNKQRSNPHTNSKTLSAIDSPLVDHFVQYLRDNFHGISRKYLQIYIASFWCWIDRKHWTLDSFAKICRRSFPIVYKELLEYVTPPVVKICVRANQIE